MKFKDLVLEETNCNLKIKTQFDLSQEIHLGLEGIYS